MTKNKKYDYYRLNTGFFPDVIKLCFSDKVFQQILADHSITLKANALDAGIAETHSIGDGKNAIVVLVFDISLVNDDLSELVDTIAHEVSHAVDSLAEHVGEEDNFVNETRAYLSGHLAGQIFKICMHEKEKYARKASRKVFSKAGKGVGRFELQVDKHGEWSARPVSLAEQSGVICGAQDLNGNTLASPNSGV